MSDERGFLTPTDRAFLRGEKEYEAKQSRYQRREAIAGRARAAFDDFAFLQEHLDRVERNRIFDVGPSEAAPVPRAIAALGDPDNDDPPTGGDLRDFMEKNKERLHLRELVADTIAFLYDTLEGDPEGSKIKDPGFPYDFSTILVGGIDRAERDRHDRALPMNAVDVTFEVDVYAPEIDYEYAVDQFARGAPNTMTERELRGLLTLLTSDMPMTDDMGRPADLRDFAEKVDQRRKELEEEREE